MEKDSCVRRTETERPRQRLVHVNADAILQRRAELFTPALSAAKLPAAIGISHKISAFFEAALRAQPARDASHVLLPRLAILGVAACVDSVRTVH